MKLLEQMGTDIVSIANNHIYDYGADAMVVVMTGIQMGRDHHLILPFQ